VQADPTVTEVRNHLQLAAEGFDVASQGRKAMVFAFPSADPTRLDGIAL
jgi:hypothetical protein